MKKLLILLFLLPFSSFAGTRVFYNGENVTSISQGSPAQGALYYNDDSPNYQAKIALIKSTPRKYLKVVNGKLVKKTQVEIDAIVQSEADAQRQAKITSIDNLDITAKDIIIALIKRINIRIPNNPINKAEVIQQIKDDKGL